MPSVRKPWLLNVFELRLDLRRARCRAARSPSAVSAVVQTSSTLDSAPLVIIR